MSEYKLVPIKSTEEMIEAARSARPYIDDDEDELKDRNSEMTWDAMVAAAPSQEVEPVAWAILAKNGKVRIWWNNKESALLRVRSNGNDYDQLDEGERFVELYLSPPTAEQAAADMKRRCIEICDIELANYADHGSRAVIKNIKRAIESLPTSAAMEEMRRDAAILAVEAYDNSVREVVASFIAERFDDSEAMTLLDRITDIGIEETVNAAIAAEEYQTEPKVTGSEN